MKRQVIYVQSNGTPRPSGDREGAKWAAGIAAALVIWKFHHFGMWALAGAAGAYLLVLIVLKSWIGGAR